MNKLTKQHPPQEGLKRNMYRSTDRKAAPSYKATSTTRRIETSKGESAFSCAYLTYKAPSTTRRIETDYACHCFW